MPTFERTTKKYYTISKDDHPNGLIRHKDASGIIHHFGGLEGILTSIDLVKDTWEGETQYKYHFKFEPEGHGSVDILQIGESASAARGLLMTLVSCPEQVGWVSVSPYRNKDEETGKTYTNLWTEVNGETVEWKDEVKDNLPEVKEVQVGDKTVLDDSARRKYIRMIWKRVTDNKLVGRVLHDMEPRAPAKVPKQDNTDGDISAGVKTTSNAPDGPPQPPPPKPDQNAGGVDMGNLDDLDDDLPF